MHPPQSPNKFQQHILVALATYEIILRSEWTDGLWNGGTMEFCTDSTIHIVF